MKITRTVDMNMKEVLRLKGSLIIRISILDKSKNLKLLGYIELSTIKKKKERIIILCFIFIN